MNTIRWILVLPSYAISFLIIRFVALFCWKGVIGMTPSSFFGIVDNFIYQIGAVIIEGSIPVIGGLYIASSIAPRKKVQVIIMLSILTGVIGVLSVIGALFGYTNNFTHDIFIILLTIATCIYTIIKVKDKKDDELEKEDLV